MQQGVWEKEELWTGELRRQGGFLRESNWRGFWFKQVGNTKGEKNWFFTKG